MSTNIKIGRVILLVAFLLIGPAAQTQDVLPLEVYAALPQVDLPDLSPSGNRLVSRMTGGGNDRIVVSDLDSGEPISIIDIAPGVEPYRLLIPQDDKVIMPVSDTVMHWYSHDPIVYGLRYLLDVSSSKTRILLDEAGTAQRGGSRVVGHNAEKQTLYMLALAQRHRLPASGELEINDVLRMGLFAVRLDKPLERKVARGNRHTRDWFVDKTGKVLIREDFNDQRNVHQIWRVDRRGKNDLLLYEEQVRIRTVNPMGLTKKRDALVFARFSKETGTKSLYLMRISDGEITGPLLARDGLDIVAVVNDINRVVYGVRYGGLMTSYAFFDDNLNQRWSEIQNMLAGTAVHLWGWDSDFSKLLVKVTGGWSSGAFLMFEVGQPKAQLLSEQRPDITSDHVVGSLIVEYKARDGLTIPALVTAKKDVIASGKAPVIVLPHDGPESYDRFSFDWMVQYFASRGYVILQPQYRGSAGFGRDFILAGRGEFGGKMQSDLDDGVQYLIDAGIADQKKVCIMGQGYGGYAALAGGAFSPDVYRCVVAISAESDLHKLLEYYKSNYGHRSEYVNYWEWQFGVDGSDKDFLQSISPAHHAKSFNAPVLLLHDRRDSETPVEQSKLMHEALMNADKEVTFVKPEVGRYWDLQSRLDNLRLIADFIDEHLKN